MYIGCTVYLAKARPWSVGTIIGMKNLFTPSTLLELDNGTCTDTAEVQQACISLISSMLVNIIMVIFNFKKFGEHWPVIFPTAAPTVDGEQPGCCHI